MDAIEQIKSDEGFSAVEYICPTGHPSIGYGTKLPLTKEEKELICYKKAEITEVQAGLLLTYRLNKSINSIQKAKPAYNTLDYARQNVIQNMMYQIGVTGVLKFQNMWKAIEAKNFCEASLHMLDSKWYREQTPKRAFRLAMEMSSSH